MKKFTNSEKVCILLYISIIVLGIIGGIKNDNNKTIIKTRQDQITQLEQKVKALNQQIEELTLIECELYWIVKYEGEMEDVNKLLRKVEEVK